MPELPLARRPPAMAELPLLPQQERWLSLDDQYPGATTPLVQLVHRLRGRLEVDAWTRAAATVVDRHEILHATFRSTVDGTVQVVGPPAGLPVELIDGTDWARPEAQAREALLDRLKVRFDPARGPLLAAHLVRLAEDDHVWALFIHHSLADGVSAVVLDREIRLCYQAFLAGAEPDLPELPIRTGDYAVWRAATHHPEDADRQHWVKHLTGAPALELRSDHPRPPAKGAPAAEVRHLIGGGIAQRVEELAGTARCTRFIVLLAAIQVLLAEWSGQRDFCVAIPVAGTERGRPELADLVGPFNNLLPVRCDLSGEPSFLALLTRLRAGMLDGLIHQELPFHKIVEALDLPADPSRTQLCQVLFSLYEQEESEPELPGLSTMDFPLPMPRIPYDLMVYAQVDATGLSLRFHYDTGLFTEPTVRRMAADFERILRAAVANPGAPWRGADA